jgi:hypothetical protein
MIIEVESNDNCATDLFVRFKEVSPARPVFQVRLYDRTPAGEWYCVTGWSIDTNAPICPAYAQMVEDSGSGLAYVVYGGSGGLRFKPSNLDEEWDIGSRQQWGEAYLLLASERDLRCGDEAAGAVMSTHMPSN